jgi:hypothetical protein
MIFDTFTLQYAYYTLTTSGVGYVVVIPAYNRPKNKVTLRKGWHVIPDARVFQLQCRSLAEGSVS